MNLLTQAVPEPTPVARSCDPLAVALANASLFGAGYLMLGRRKLAVVTGLVTVVLVALLLAGAGSVWAEVVLLLWWAVLIAHGWFLAGAHTQRVGVRGQRLAALAVTVPLLLAVGLLRFDAAMIERTVVEARHSGDCAQATAALDRVWLGHRVVDGPLTLRGDRTVEACQRLRAAREELATGLTGDTAALQAGFDGLAAVLREQPGHERMVNVVLEGFLGGLPTANPCQTVAVTDWLRQRQTSDEALDRSIEVVVRTAPAALVGCADGLMAAGDWETARTRYQQLLDQYRGQGFSTRASEGVKRATLAIELANVRSLLEGSTGGQPDYCSRPARYSGAAPYRKGTNRALIYGNDEYAKKLPSGWRATDVVGAVLVVCAGEAEFGTTVRTCPYENKISRQFPTYVAFRKIAIPVKAYELRTGKLVVNTRVQISGSSCPRILRYTRYTNLVDIGPPSEVYVTASIANVRAAFQPVIIRG